MKILYLVFPCLILKLPLQCQTDTLIWEVSRQKFVNHPYPDGYHIFKENERVVKEYPLRKGQLDGVLKEYHPNGMLKLIAEYKPYFNHNISYLCGIYQEYDENGRLKLTGNYRLSDSVECVHCFDADLEMKRSQAQNHSERIGLWKEYYPSGIIKSAGKYKGIHETNYTCHSLNEKPGTQNVFTPGDYSEEYLKDSKWNYYNEQGVLIKEEFYFEGMLCDIQIFGQ